MLTYEMIQNAVESLKQCVPTDGCYTYILPCSIENKRLYIHGPYGPEEASAIGAKLFNNPDTIDQYPGCKYIDFGCQSVVN